MDIVEQLRADRSAQNVGTGEACAPWLLVKAADEIERLRACITEMETRPYPLSADSNRLYRFLNGLDIDDLDARAESLMKTHFDGVMVGPGNRCTIKQVLALHFHDIRDAAKAAQTQMALSYRAETAKDDRPGVPDGIERAAIAAFQADSKGMTGHVWDWEESNEEIRNIWRIKAMLAMLT